MPVSLMINTIMLDAVMLHSVRSSVFLGPKIQYTGLYPNTLVSLELPPEHSKHLQ
jgi:hypothetical protein